MTAAASRRAGESPWDEAGAMSDFVVAIGLVLAIEGTLYAAAPGSLS